MSLHIAAKHLASKGRGPDTQLVHMAPSEVAGLQALAKAGGGSLTINPETGLPEAGFLSNMLPMVIGAGLSVASGGTLTPMMAGLMTGAGYGLIKGDLKAGLMAGLGAYGGAGMMGSVLGAGADAAAAAGMQGAQTAANAAATTVPTAAETAGMNQAFEQSLASHAAAPAGLVGTGAAMGAADANMAYAPQQFAANAGQAAQAAAPITQMPSQVAINQQLGDAAVAAKDQYLNNTGFVDQMKGGLGAIAQNPSQLMTKDNLKYGLAAAAPAMMQTPTTTPYKSDSEQHQYTYSPGKTQNPEYLTSATATPSNSYERQWFTPSYTRVMASGGPVSDMSARNENLILLANGGQQFAEGGSTDLGSYSDGGRMLRGPGDGVSDSIPATIAGNQPARLADGEFVVPARIVSELGNGSSEAGARKLYSMMDRVQKARAKTVGKNAVATDSKAEKMLPA